MTVNLLQSQFHQETGTVGILKKLDAGISVESIEHLAAYLGISVNELLVHLRLSRSTWHRRKKTGTLDFDLSDRVFQASRLLEYAGNVFGSREKVRLWFTLPSIVFENKRPVELIGSISGWNLINDELIRIEHGIFA